jgi:ankyrin repeat protein
MSGDLRRVKWLLEKGIASITDTDPHGSTALHRAAYKGELEVMQWLVEEGGADLTACNIYGRTIWDMLDPFFNGRN